MKIKIVLLLAVFAAICGSASAQGIRVPLNVQQQNTVAGVTNVVTIPTTATVAFCSAPANAVPCTNKATTYTDATLGTPCSTSTQIVLDGTNTCVAQLNSQATGGVWVAIGQYAYTITYGGANFGPFFVTAGSTSAIAGSLATNQVAVAVTTNTIGGTNNFQYIPANGGLGLFSSNVGPTNITGSAVYITNSLGGGTTYFVKGSDGSFRIRNDSLLVSAHGDLFWDNNSNMTLQGGSNSPSLTFYTGACNTPSICGVGSAILTLNASGITPHIFGVTGSAGSVALDPYLTGVTMYGGTSGSASWGIAAIAGTPNKVNVPTSTGNAGQVLKTDGGSPQQTSWTTLGAQCGTIAAGGACANTTTTAEHCISGIATLSGGASTITAISPAFTSSTSFTVITNDATTKANASNAIPASGSSITFSGTGTDNINFVACGG